MPTPAASEPLNKMARAAIAAHVLERCFAQHWAAPPASWLPAPPEIHYTRVIRWTIEGQDLARSVLYAGLLRRGYHWDPTRATWDLPADSPLWHLVDAFRAQAQAAPAEIERNRGYAARGAPAGPPARGRAERDAIRAYVVHACFAPYVAARSVSLLSAWKCHLRRVIPATLRAARMPAGERAAWLAEHGYTWSDALGWSATAGIALPHPFRPYRDRLLAELAAEPGEVAEVE